MATSVFKYDKLNLFCEKILQLKSILFNSKDFGKCFLKVMLTIIPKYVEE